MGLKITGLAKFFFNGLSPASVSLIFLATVEYIKSVANGIWTRIVRIEGKDADHFTTTTANLLS